ncbi:hypothetical protein [Gracilinema caldarium]|uniref:hypothetical protein n=1 Tax=Gracilinema caldarium TaxID=215591 RepID=UPI0026ED315E|nr:hypothetical protein [Gracilinema caldarium]
MEISFIFSVASLILWAFSFLYVRSLIIKRTSKDRILAEFRDEVDRLIADIDAATDRDIGLIEDRLKTLKALLDETDKRIISYTKELQRRAMQEQAYAELGRRQSAARPVQRNPITQERQDSLFDENKAASQTAEKTVQDEESAGETPQPIQTPRFVKAEKEIKPKPPSFSEQVLELYLAGFSPELIASKLKVTVAEVDLAINVSGKSRGNSPT